MKYLVIAKVSRSFHKVWGPGCAKTITCGPYKRLSTAKRKRAKLRKERILTIVEFADGWHKDEAGSWVSEDQGPSYTRVWIEEVAE